MNDDRVSETFAPVRWAKLVAPVVVAAVTAFGAAHQAAGGKVSDGEFSRVAVTNCQGINELRAVLRKIIADAPRDPADPVASERFIADAVAQLETVDCSQLVDPQVRSGAAREAR